MDVGFQHLAAVDKLNILAFQKLDTVGTPGLGSRLLQRDDATFERRISGALTVHPNAPPSVDEAFEDPVLSFIWVGQFHVSPGENEKTGACKRTVHGHRVGILGLYPDVPIVGNQSAQPLRDTVLDVDRSVGADHGFRDTTVDGTGGLVAQIQSRRGHGRAVIFGSDVKFTSTTASWVAVTS